MIRKWAMTGGGLGYAPVASGTFGSAGAIVIALLAWAIIHNSGAGPMALNSVWLVLALLASIGCVRWGPWAIEYFAGKARKPGDPGQVVIDELAGQWIALVALPMPTFKAAITVMAVQFFFFRLFDVIKPPPGRRLEKLPGGWGILLDDLAAGIYANLIGQIIFRWSAVTMLVANDSVRAIILGIVEGLTEFLPISSTGHMILVEPLLGIPTGDPFWTGVFDIFIQLGAILAVVIYFWRRLWRLTVHPAAKPWHEHIMVKLFVAFLPAAVIGLSAGDFIEEHLKNPLIVAWALVVGGVLILFIEWRVRIPKIADAASISLRIALLIGVAQCFALIPGTSRSGATIMGALLLGLTPAAAAEFSFFLAIPTMFAAGIYTLLKHLEDIQPGQYFTLGVGFVVAFIVAWAVIAAFMRFIQTHRFTSFAIYRIIIGGIVLAVLLLNHRPG